MNLFISKYNRQTNIQEPSKTFFHTASCENDAFFICLVANKLCKSFGINYHFGYTK